MNYFIHFKLLLFQCRQTIHKNTLYTLFHFVFHNQHCESLETEGQEKFMELSSYRTNSTGLKSFMISVYLVKMLCKHAVDKERRKIKAIKDCFYSPLS